MADEIVIFVVRDNLGEARDLGELIDGAQNIWALRSHDPKAFTALESIKTNTDQLEGFLNTIRDNADQVETLLTALGDNTDQLEGFTDTLETKLDNVVRGYTGIDTKFDYGIRTDKRPVRIGKCAPGAPDADPHVIFTFTYDAGNRVTKISYSTGAWA